MTNTYKIEMNSGLSFEVVCNPEDIEKILDLLNRYEISYCEEL